MILAYIHAPLPISHAVGVLCFVSIGSLLYGRSFMMDGLNIITTLILARKGSSLKMEILKLNERI